MAVITSSCVHCNQLVTVDTASATIPDMRCGYCGRRQRQLIYPAYCQEPAGTAIVPVLEEGASCYFHDSTAASAICDDCGRYLCELCTLPIPMPASLPAGFPERLCSSCFAHRMAEEERDQAWDLFRTSYVRYDTIALGLALLPIILFPLFSLGIVAFPIAIYLVVRHWHTCHSPVQHFRRNMTIALVLAGGGMVAWMAILSMAAARWL
jgi:hypothetical protein